VVKKTVRPLQNDVFEKKNKPGKTAAIPSEQTPAEKIITQFYQPSNFPQIFVGGDAAEAVRR